MGLMPQEKTERNDQIVKDIRTMSLTEVATKHNLSKQRVSQIIGGVKLYRPIMPNTKVKDE